MTPEFYSRAYIYIYIYSYIYIYRLGVLKAITLFRPICQAELCGKSPRHWIEDWFASVDQAIFLSFFYIYVLKRFFYPHSQHKYIVLKIFWLVPWILKFNEKYSSYIKNYFITTFFFTLKKIILSFFTLNKFLFRR